MDCKNNFARTLPLIAVCVVLLFYVQLYIKSWPWVTTVSLNPNKVILSSNYGERSKVIPSPNYGERPRIQKRPHIIYFLADDLGFNDVPWHNPRVIAPNLKALADSGLILEQVYVQPVCSPTRAAILSGVYPFTVGIQGTYIMMQSPTGLSDNVTVLPQYLKALGYNTHAIGKWHLGFCKWSYTPTERGFDTFHGFYLGDQNYYNKKAGGGLDCRVNKEVCDDPEYRYSTYESADHFRNIVRNANNSTPLFIYMAFQSVHGPLQAPSKYLDLYPDVQDNNRKTLLAMVFAMDKSIGMMIQSLKDAGIYDNSIIIFSTDNGGHPSRGGNNWPLRGGKATLYEGGTRGAAFLHSKLFQFKGKKSDILMHAIDWVPTVLSMAGGKTPPNIDGVDQWEAILGKTKNPPRKEVVYDLLKDKERDIIGVIRYGQYKLMIGDVDYQKQSDARTPAPEALKNESVVPKPTAIFNASEEEINRVTLDEDLLEWFEYLKSADLKQQLYDLQNDPNEMKNLASDKKEIVHGLIKRLLSHMDKYVDPYFPPQTQKANPSNWNGVWSPGWC